MDILADVIGVDIETMSACDLDVAGAWAYSRHESTDVYCVSFVHSHSNGPRVVMEWEPGEELPRLIRGAVAAGCRLVAHNASFEISIWENILQEFYGFPPVPLDQWVDTQILGLAVALPKSLDGLTAALGCPTPKDKPGQALMRKMATLVPDGDGGYRTKVEGVDTEENRKRLSAYCTADVQATLDAYERLRPLDLNEYLIQQVDTRINHRGVYLDRGFARHCATVVGHRTAQLDAEVLTGLGDEWQSLLVADSRNPTALKTYLHAHGVDVPVRARKKKAPDGSVTVKHSESTDKAAIAEILERSGLPASVRTLLNNRTEAAKATSLAKLHRVGEMVDVDGRLRFALQYHGAHTGRWTSSGFQIHNLPKDKLEALSGLVHAAVEAEDLDALSFLTGSPLAAVSQCLRAIIAAPPGKELIAADYSAIEARVIAWLADEMGKLEAFYRGEDVYVLAARNAGSTSRPLGKVQELALGYGMGVVLFIDTAFGWGITLVPKEAKRIHTAWREGNARIVQLWHDLEDRAKDAICNRGAVYHVAGGRVEIQANAQCLFLRLPSGRRLRYWQPRIQTRTSRIKVVDDDGTIVEKDFEREEIVFLASKKGRLMPESTYAGSWQRTSPRPLPGTSSRPPRSPLTGSTRTNP